MSLTASGRVPKVTLNNYIKGQTENIYRQDAPLALLRQRGRMMMSSEGENLDWLVMMDEGAESDRADGAPAVFDSPDRHKKAVIGWGKMEQFEQLTKGEKLKNKGKAARVKLADNITKWMTAEIGERFCRKFYQDGTAVGLVDPLYGLQSILGKAADATVQYPVPSSSHTYATLKMNPAGYGGAAVGSSVWPSGQFDKRYHFWTPLQVNAAHAGFGGSTWAANGPKALRRLIGYQTDLRGKSAAPSVFLMRAEPFMELKDSQDDKQRITVGKKVGLVSLGFSNVMEFDGVECTSEPNVPDGMCVGLALDHIEVHSLQDQLFKTEDDYDLTDKTSKFSIDFWGQFKFNPWALCAAIGL